MAQDLRVARQRGTSGQVVELTHEARDASQRVVRGGPRRDGLLPRHPPGKERHRLLAVRVVAQQARRT